ncbi:putative E3 ubiquitin-protein ligase RING1b [Phalaenopsis equestris]|uniref:putative E3 ubiquitin-protein ligase RING1b n=1 Tax=Phalaenopsis equestris TaxID=78828 RepID=UPI0009E1CA06|nr:putative E3 ubiquitin-protein ligase RING1b [Phalaenopsis equestris]
MAPEKRAARTPWYTSDEANPTEMASEPPAGMHCAGGGDDAPPPTSSPGFLQGQHAPDSEGEDGEASSQSSDDEDEYILVQLEDVSKEVQCSICLGVIRKTRTVMECLHRFCRECIDKAMRLGNKECPTCRTHCPSRRWLRDDPNFDALIAALYPDIDFDALIDSLYPEDNFEEEIQAPKAEAFRHSEPLGLRRTRPISNTAATYMRKSQHVYHSGNNNYYRRRVRPAARNISHALPDHNKEKDVRSTDAIKRPSSLDELSPDRIRKRRRLVAPTSSPARLDLGFEKYGIDLNRENSRTSPLPAGKNDLSWGKGGVRSQTRHSNSIGSNGRSVRAARLARLIEHLHNVDENEDKFHVHLKLLPLNEQSLPLESPHLCCPPTSSVRHILQFIAMQTSGQVRGIDLFVRKPPSPTSQPTNQVERNPSDVSDEMRILGEDESLAGLLTCFTSSTQGDLELMYRINARNGF